MPLFRFKCQDCGKEFEELVRSSTEKIVCPKCNGENIKKQFPNKFSFGGGTASAGTSIPSSSFS